MGRDQSPYPWICSQTRICNQTRYRLGYAARYTEVRSYAPYPHPPLEMAFNSRWQKGVPITFQIGVFAHFYTNFDDWKDWE